MESVAVFRRADAQMLVENPPERLPGAEAAAAGDGFHRIRALGERPPRGLDPHPFYVAARRHADLIGEAALQLASTHPGMAGQIADGMPGTGICLDGRYHLPDRIGRRLRRPQRHAELRLTARTTKEQH